MGLLADRVRIARSHPRVRVAAFDATDPSAAAYSQRHRRPGPSFPTRELFSRPAFRVHPRSTYPPRIRSGQTPPPLLACPPTRQDRPARRPGSQDAAGQGRPSHAPHRRPAPAHPPRSPPTSSSPNPFSLSIYGDPAAEIDDLVESIREPRDPRPPGRRPPRGRAGKSSPATAGWPAPGRWACPRSPARSATSAPGAARRRAVLEYNRQRRKTFSQLMREADALEVTARGRGPPAPARRTSASSATEATRRSSGFRRSGRPDRRGHRPGPRARRQGPLPPGPRRLAGRPGGRPPRRSAWPSSTPGPRRSTPLTRTCAAATASPPASAPPPTTSGPSGTTAPSASPTPARSPRPSSPTRSTTTPSPGALVVDPMAGGGTTLDVCASMGRRCLAYDLHPVRPDIRPHDVNDGFPPEASGCDLIFCDPPYHTMLARRYAERRASTRAPWPPGSTSSTGSRATPSPTLRPGGYVALLLANQTEKDLPAGYGYIDHAFLGYQALLAAGFLPERRISCPMDGAYLPQHVRARPGRGPDARPGPRPARHAQAAGRTGFRTAARRRPARRPCPARTGWRGSGCGGRSARGVTQRPAGSGLAAPRAGGCSITRLIAASSSARAVRPRCRAARARAASEPRFELPPPALQPVGDLRQEVVAVLDPRADIAGAVLELALALEIERVEEDLRDVLRVLLRGEPLGELAREFPGPSAIPANRQQQAAVPRRRGGTAFPGSGCWRCLLSFLVLVWAQPGACRAEELGQCLERIWAGLGGSVLKNLDHLRRPPLKNLDRLVVGFWDCLGLLARRPLGGGPGG